ncbi:hypothetical protein HKBW3S42_02136, partial [Candidatus Hakubella thermalkaliphila]
FKMHRKIILPRFYKIVQVFVRLFYHQMHIKRNSCYLFKCFYNLRPYRYIRHKMAVHYIYVKHVNPCSLRVLYLLAYALRRSDFLYAASFNCCILEYWAIYTL